MRKIKYNDILLVIAFSISSLSKIIIITINIILEFFIYYDYSIYFINQKK